MVCLQACACRTRLPISMCMPATACQVQPADCQLLPSIAACAARLSMLSAHCSISMDSSHLQICCTAGTDEASAWPSHRAAACIACPATQILTELSCMLTSPNSQEGPARTPGLMLWSVPQSLLTGQVGQHNRLNSPGCIAIDKRRYTACLIFPDGGVPSLTRLEMPPVACVCGWPLLLLLIAA